MPHRLSAADFLRLALLLSVSQQQTSFDWRFFQPLSRTLLSTGVSLSLSAADFFRLAFLSAFQEHASFGWRFSQPLSSRPLSTDVSSLSLSAADFFRLALLLSASQQQTSFDWRFFFQPLSSRLPSTGASFNLSRARFFWLAYVSLLRFRRPTVTFSRAACATNNLRLKTPCNVQPTPTASRKAASAAMDVSLLYLESQSLLITSHQWQENSVRPICLIGHSI
ncbi:MAG TPA: hypothetical protein PKH77_15390 [Anaerolineae bacterium]|nr:hypothetical protein [Anaerolineae bacterium]